MAQTNCGTISNKLWEFDKGRIDAVVKNELQKQLSTVNNVFSIEVTLTEEGLQKVLSVYI